MCYYCKVSQAPVRWCKLQFIKWVIYQEEKIFWLAQDTFSAVLAGVTLQHRASGNLKWGPSAWGRKSGRNMFSAIDEVYLWEAVQSLSSWPDKALSSQLQAKCCPALSRGLGWRPPRGLPSRTSSCFRQHFSPFFLKRVICLWWRQHNESVYILTVLGRDSVCNEDLRRTLNLASLSLSQGQSVFAKPNYMRKVSHKPEWVRRRRRKSLCCASNKSRWVWCLWNEASFLLSFINPSTNLKQGLDSFSTALLYHSVSRSNHFARAFLSSIYLFIFTQPHRKGTKPHQRHETCVASPGRAAAPSMLHWKLFILYIAAHLFNSPNCNVARKTCTVFRARALPCL